VVTCPIVRGEVLFGIARDCRRANGAPSWKRQGASSWLSSAANRSLYAAVKLARQQRGLSLDENDLWVAATALALGATLVSRDSDFESIDGLPIVALA
jgi:predicted nucleic acid-binding protein